MYWQKSGTITRVDRVGFKSSNRGPRKVLRGLREKGKLAHLDTLIINYSASEGTDRALHALHYTSLYKDLLENKMGLIILEDQNFFNTISLLDVIKYLTKKHRWVNNLPRNFSGDPLIYVEQALAALSTGTIGKENWYVSNAYELGVVQNSPKRGHLVSRLVDEKICEGMPGVLCVDPLSSKDILHDDRVYY